MVIGNPVKSCWNGRDCGEHSYCNTRAVMARSSNHYSTNTVGWSV